MGEKCSSCQWNCSCLTYSMNSHQIVGYGVTGAGLTYSSSYPSVPAIPKRLLDSLKLELGNSPNSPSSTPFDCDTSTTLSDSCTDISGFSASSGSPPEASSYSLWTSPSLDRWQDSPQHFHDGQNMRQVLQKLESALMGPDDDVHATTSTSPRDGNQMLASGQGTRASSQDHPGTHVIQHQHSFASSRTLSREGSPGERRKKPIEETSAKSSPPNDLKGLLIACASALAENDFTGFDSLIDKARTAVSINGEPIQRLGAYIVEGLVARKESSGSNIYRALRCREPESSDLLSYMQILYEICPYLKFGYMAANGAIAEACRNEDRIHIIDFQISQGTQWMTLLQALAARPGGAPHVRITGIDDLVSKYARGDGLEAVGRRLAVVSQMFSIPVKFQGLPFFAPDIRREMLDVRPGEALVVNFPLQLHHIADESVDVNNPRDGLLRMVRSLNPKVVTLVEQESNTNTAPFLPRFIEALEYYLAMFESIDVVLPWDRKERIAVEQHCLAKEIVNVIACEGKERAERHELFGKWKSRFTMAGFRQYPLSSYVNSVIRSLLRRYSEHYTLVEKDGAMLLGWKDRNLVSASAWH